MVTTKRFFTPLLALLLVALGAVAAPRAQAQQGLNWNADYYNNGFLLGERVFQTGISTPANSLSLNWGTGSPAPQVNADGFSGRFSTQAYFPGGTYRFYLLADDAANIRIDFLTPILSTLDNPQPGVIVTADVPIAEGVRNIQVNYREDAGDAYLYVSWANVATNPTGPGFTPPVTIPGQPGGQVPTGNWTAQYYSNRDLAGTPVAILSEPTPTRNWGASAPLPNVPADNFSVRWSTTQALNAGTYRITVRADDGVRVFVNGINYINQWNLATGQTYTADFPTPGGSSNIVVEYFEAGGEAFIEFNLQQLTGTGTPGVPGVTPPQVQPPVTSPTGQVVTVTAGRLNVRNAPNPISGAILTRIDRNQQFPALGRNASNTWIFIDVNGTRGWASAAYLTGVNVAALPLTDAPGTGQPAPNPTGFVVSTSVNLNIRSGPSTQFNRIAVLPAGSQAQVVGRNATTTWYQISFDGQTGWVSGTFARLQSGVNVAQIPVTG